MSIRNILVGREYLDPFTPETCWKIKFLPLQIMYATGQNQLASIK